MPVVATAQEAAPTLTLEECIARALGKNFDLQIQTFTKDSAAQSLLIAEADFEPDLAFTTSRSESVQATASSTLDGAANPSSTAYNNRLSATQRISTGATVTAATNLNRAGSNSRNTLLIPSFNSDFSLTVRQPILSGAGRAFNRAAIERAKIGLDRSNLDFKTSVLTVVRNAETAYYNVGFAREQLAVRRFSLELAERLLEENKARMNTGIATDLEDLQAEVGVANARRALIQAEQTVRNNEDTLLNLIGRFEFNSPLGGVSLADAPVPATSFERSYQLARENAPSYASTKLSIEQIKIDVMTTKSQAKPALSVGATGGYNAREGEPGRSYEELWSGDGYNWTLDLQLNMPLGFKAEKARHRQAIINLAREEARLQQIEQTLLVDVRSAVRSVETNIESVAISAKATELSQRQFDLEKARFDAGISTFRRVQETQEDLDTARVAELQARIALRIALADLARLEASSLERYKITVDQE
ncbi:efflux transporter outer membrane subunit [Opitutaceae bacterium]